MKEYIGCILVCFFMTTVINVVFGIFLIPETPWYHLVVGSVVCNSLLVFVCWICFRILERKDKKKLRQNKSGQEVAMSSETKDNDADKGIATEDQSGRQE